MRSHGRHLTIVETAIFAKRRPDILDDEEYRLLQLTIARDPAIGTLIPGTGGIRKARWQLEGRGKSGGARVIYYWAVSREVVLMLHLYAKNERADLTKDQLRLLAATVKGEFK
jgi:hypothetical protein